MFVLTVYLLETIGLCFKSTIIIRCSFQGHSQDSMCSVQDIIFYVFEQVSLPHPHSWCDLAVVWSILCSPKPLLDSAQQVEAVASLQPWCRWRLVIVILSTPGDNATRYIMLTRAWHSTIQPGCASEGVLCMPSFAHWGTCVCDFPVQRISGNAGEAPPWDLSVMSLVGTLAWDGDGDGTGNQFQIFPLCTTATVCTVSSDSWSVPFTQPSTPSFRRRWYVSIVVWVNQAIWEAGEKKNQS